MVVGAKVCELTDGFLWFVCGLYVVILTSPLKACTHRLIFRGFAAESAVGMWAKCVQISPRIGGRIG